MSDIHAVTKDQTAWTKKKLSAIDYLKYAAQTSGRGFFELALEYGKLHNGQGKLTLEEYVQYRVYQTDTHTPEEQARFITNSLHWSITHVCCDMSWQAVTEDKWLCSNFLKDTSVSVPQTLAVIDKSNRTYPHTHKISTVDQLRDFMVSKDFIPCFGKEIRGICSFGAFQIEEADNRRLHIKNEGWMDYESFLNGFVGETNYIIQQLQKNHKFFDQKTKSLATIRICILLTDNGVKIPFAILKLPADDQLADSFWRPGNIACNLNPLNGEILSVRTKNKFETVDHITHPGTKINLIGDIIPMWDKIINLVHSCAPIFQPVKYQSMDIAVTEQGPVLIEINTGGGFDLPQLASGEGFLTDEVIEFFRACGYKNI